RVRALAVGVRVADVPAALDHRVIDLRLARRRVLDRDVERHEADAFLVATRRSLLGESLLKLPPPRSIEGDARLLRSLAGGALHHASAGGAACLADLDGARPVDRGDVGHVDELAAVHRRGHRDVRPARLDSVEARILLFRHGQLPPVWMRTRVFTCTIVPLRLISHAPFSVALGTFRMSSRAAVQTTLLARGPLPLAFLSRLICRALFTRCSISDSDASVAVPSSFSTRL